MIIEIRTPEPEEYDSVFKLIKDAFKDDVNSDHTEQELVRRLIGSTAFIPELSLVAVSNEEISGYILLSRITIINSKTTYPFLSLAPVCVAPTHQNKGIGSALINHAHALVKDMGEPGIALIGHATYYPRFGYKPASDFGIRFPFDIPEEFCMVRLFEGKNTPSGMVEYPAAFFN